MSLQGEKGGAMFQVSKIILILSLQFISNGYVFAAMSDFFKNSPSFNSLAGINDDISKFKKPTEEEKMKIYFCFLKSELLQAGALSSSIEKVNNDLNQCVQFLNKSNFEESSLQEAQTFAHQQILMMEIVNQKCEWAINFQSQLVNKGHVKSKNSLCRNLVNEAFRTGLTQNELSSVINKLKEKTAQKANYRMRM